MFFNNKKRLKKIAEKVYKNDIRFNNYCTLYELNNLLKHYKKEKNIRQPLFLMSKYILQYIVPIIFNEYLILIYIILFIIFFAISTMSHLNEIQHLNYPDLHIKLPDFKIHFSKIILSIIFFISLLLYIFLTKIGVIMYFKNEISKKDYHILFSYMKEQNIIKERNIIKEKTDINNNSIYKKNRL